MAPDGITAGVVERCFKRITQDERHDYKVKSIATTCSCFFHKLRSFFVHAICVNCIVTEWKLRTKKNLFINQTVLSTRTVGTFWKNVLLLAHFRNGESE